MTRPSPGQGALVIEMAGVSKAFHGVMALRDVGFACHAGEVHALVGENGAGKSTLIKILSGAYRPDRGALRMAGRPIAFAHPLDALNAGVSVIHQEFSLLPERTVAQNVFLGREPTRRGVIDAAAMRAETARALDLLGAPLDPDARVGELAIAERQMVEIAKAISLDARVLVMDEPTAALNEHECAILYRTVETLAARGVAVVYITHRMREVSRLAARVTVLKDGEVAARFDTQPAPQTIVRAMVGRDIADFYAPPATPAEIGAVVLDVRGLATATLRDVGFELRAGEIVGFAGLQGAGRAALAMALYGEAAITAGSVSLDGAPVAFRSPRAAISGGLGLLPGDRKAEGLALMQSVRDNGMLGARAFARLLARRSTHAHAGATYIDALLDRMDVRAASYDQEIRFLSGGNQQKTILARWLALDPRVLIFIEPTRGVHVNAKAGIYRLMRDLARRGAAIMMISSDLPELIGAADRILVMRDGAIVAEFGHGAAEAAIMLAATGEREAAA